jgi:hypothetical protein
MGKNINPQAFQLLRNKYLIGFIISNIGMIDIAPINNGCCNYINITQARRSL